MVDTLRVASVISAACGVSILGCALIVLAFPVPESVGPALVDVLYLFPAFAGVVAAVVAVSRWRHHTPSMVLAGQALSLLLPVAALAVGVSPWATGWELLALPLAFALGQVVVLVALVVSRRRWADRMWHHQPL